MTSVRLVRPRYEWLAGSCTVRSGLDDPRRDLDPVVRNLHQHAAQQVRSDVGRRLSEEGGQAPAELHRPLRRKRRSLDSGHALMTSSFVSQPRCAVATPYRMTCRCVTACESVSTANFTP